MNTETAPESMIKGVWSEPGLRSDFYASSAVSTEVRIYDLDRLRSGIDSSVTRAANDNASHVAPWIDDTEWIGDVFEKLVAKIPPEAWDNVPSNMSATIDESLYGRKP
jgi:hypothetical protein